MSLFDDKKDLAPSKDVVATKDTTTFDKGDTKGATTFDKDDTKGATTPAKGDTKKKQADTKKEKAPRVFRLPFTKKEEPKAEETKAEIPKGTIRQEYPGIADQYTASTVGKNWLVDYKAPKYIYKPLVDKKLTILLIENTKEVEKQLNMITKIVSSLITEGDVCIINYGSTHKQSEIMSATQLKSQIISAQLQNQKALLSQEIGENACLFDALVALEILVNQKLLSVEEGVKERTRINGIDIIGIGTGKEQGSKVLKAFALKAFARVAKKPKVVTKYFCLTETSFLQVAEIGFHSIGSMDRTY